MTTVEGGFHDLGFVACVGYQAIEGLGGFGPSFIHFGLVNYPFPLRGGQMIF